MGKKSQAAWTSLLDIRGGGSTASRLQRQRAELLHHWSTDVWAWLTGVDPTTHDLPWAPDHHFDAGVPLIWTTDERDNEAPIKAWPGHLEYLMHYTRAAVSMTPENRIILIDKSRQMLASTALLLAWDWWCRTMPNRLILWSKISQEQAADMLNEKVRPVHTRLPQWVKEAWPISMTPLHRIKYGATGSQLRAVNEATARGSARGSTATAIGIDEAAYMDLCEDIWDAAQPMAAKLVLLTTALVGPPGATFFLDKISEGRKYRAAQPRA